MKRGLVVLDPTEIPPGELDERVAELQDTLTDLGVAAALIYGDVYHSGDITYLSNICIYWNEGILLVPASGAATFITKLSPRVHNWMRATSNLTQLRSGPNLARLAAETLAGLPGAPAGLIEEAWWPALLVQELRDALGSRETRDLGPLVRRRRRSPSPAEFALLERSAAIAESSVASASERGLSLKERAGVAEKTARMAGVEDVTVACHPVTPEAATVEVVAEFRGYWTTAARLLAAEETDWSSAFRRAYAAAAATLAPGRDLRTVADAAAPALAALDRPWRIDLVQHMNIETNGGYRTVEESSAAIGAGDVVALRMELDLTPGSQAVLADTYAIGDHGARCLTGQTLGGMR